MIREFRLFTGIAAGIFLLFSLHGAQQIKTVVPAKNMALISRTASCMIASMHYNQHKIDDRISDQLFQDYFSYLDPSHMFFTQDDIRAFEKNRYVLGEQLLKGDVRFAFLVFDRFKKRLTEYEAFAKEYLKSDPNLNTSLEFDLDRKKVPYPAGETELHELWKKKILNELILMELSDRSVKQNADPKKTAVQKKTPAERTLSRLSMYMNHYNQLEANEILETYLSTLARIYDPHSEYLSPRSEEDFNIQMKLSLVGIGAVLTNEGGYTKIVKIIPGGPAEKDGRLKAEDKIIAVTQQNGERVDLLDMPVSKVVDYIRGKENSKVTLTILQAEKGSSAVPVEISLIRKKVILKESEATGRVHEIKEKRSVKRIGVITLPSFYIDFNAAYRGDSDYKSSAKDVARLIREFSKEKAMDGLILDLRSNGGGSLVEAVQLTGLFIKDGPVVQVRSIKNKNIHEDEDGGRIAYSGPLIVMTNRFSASASEIFAGAIKDYQRGIIVGDAKTHGKGSVQTMIELGRYTAFFARNVPSGSLKLTNAKFYRINGESTQLRGITPDIVFPSFTDVMELGEDQLPHALPWDSIEPLRHVQYDRELPEEAAVLNQKSQERIKNNPDFQRLQKNIAYLKKIRERKSVSLNLEKRWQEYLKEKALQEQQDQLMHLDKDGSVKNTVTKDLYLDETIRIMNDYIQLKSKEEKAH